jgi:hypothetical protein
LPTLAVLPWLPVLARVGAGIAERIAGVVLGQLIAVGAIIVLAVLPALAGLRAGLAVGAVLTVRSGCSILACRGSLAGVPELLAVGRLVLRQLLGQIIQLILRETQRRRVVANDGLGRAFHAHAKLVEVLRRAGLERARLADQSIIHQLRAVL